MDKYSYLFAEYKATKKSGAVFRSKRTEDIVEDEFCEEKLVSSADLAGNTTFHIDDIRRCGEA